MDVLVSSPLLCCDKIPERNQKRKGLFWLTVPGVSGHDHLAWLLLGLWQDSVSWWEHMSGKAAHLTAAKNHFPETPPLNTAALGAEAAPMSFWRTFQIQP
jgi:hypothetical protein